jgi:hypothetical protein
VAEGPSQGREKFVQQPERSETVSAVAHEVDMIDPKDSIWNKMGRLLKNWGGKIWSVAKKAGSWIWSVAKKAGSWIARGAKWIAGTPAAKFVASKAKWLAGKSWFGLKWFGGKIVNLLAGPVGWVLAPLLAVIFAPKAIAVMLLIVIVGLLLLTLGMFFVWREVKDVSSPEDLTERFDNMSEKVVRRLEVVTDAKQNVRVNDLHYSEIVDEPTAGETMKFRHGYLTERIQDMVPEQDPERFSELTMRIHLLEVRNGMPNPDGSKRKLEAARDKTTWSEIYRDCVRKAEQEKPTFPWKKSWMDAAARNEDKRLNEIARLRKRVENAKQTDENNLTPVS